MIFSAAALPGFDTRELSPAQDHPLAPANKPSCLDLLPAWFQGGKAAIFRFTLQSPVSGLAASSPFSCRQGRESPVPTTAAKHPNQCTKKRGEPARHLEAQPLLSAALPITPHGIRKTALTRKLTASLLKESEGLKSNPHPPRKRFQLHFSCSLGSTLQLAVEELLCNAANASHIPFPSLSLHPGPSRLRATGAGWWGGPRKHCPPIKLPPTCTR